MEGGKGGRMEEGKTERQWLAVSGETVPVACDQWSVKAVGRMEDEKT